MMDCTHFEDWMADAIGGELSAEDQAIFDAHVMDCASCRREYESLAGTVNAMQELPGPQRVSVRQEGSRLVLEDFSSARMSSGDRSQPQHAGTNWGRGLLRSAAGLLIAFTAGYAFHAYRMASDAAQNVPVVVQAAEADENLEETLVSTHTRKPRRSKLATCLIAMSVQAP